MAKALRAFLEICHDGPRELEPWLTALLPAMGAVAAPSQGFSISRYRSAAYMITRCSHWGRAEALATLVETFNAGPARSLRPGLFAPFRVSTLSAHLGQGTDIATVLRALGSPRGLIDNVGMCVVVDDSAIVASLPLWDDDPKPCARRSLLRLQRHLASGSLARSAAHQRRDPEAILDAQGAVLDARVDSKLLARARAVAKSLANDLDGREDESTESLWQSLWEGGYGIARVVDTDGKRLFLLRRMGPDRVHRRLSPVEARVVQLAARGKSLKVIASELGTGASTVSSQLQLALGKLGLEDRVQLVRLFAGLRVDSGAEG